MPKITKLHLHLLKLFSENFWLLFYRTWCSCCVVVVAVVVVTYVTVVHNEAVIVVVVVVVFCFRCIYTVSQKKLCQCYFVNNSVKHWPNLIIFGMQHREET